MEKESVLTGYCRCLDKSRIVIAVTEQGELLEVDCSFETCIHAPNCTVAENIRQLLQSN